MKRNFLRRKIAVRGTALASTRLNSEAKHQAAAKRHPLQQVGDPEDTAKLVAFLLITGAACVVASDSADISTCFRSRVSKALSGDSASETGEFSLKARTRGNQSSRLRMR